MFPQAPYRLLEINVISAHDLPPVSKMLRAYVVAWLDSGHKLTTRVNQDGHTNPAWNYKLVFYLDDRFLNSDSTAIKFEIYNVAWLRDIPIGTARLMLNSFLPPLSAKKPAIRHAALQIRRPSGHLQGTLSVTIQLIDNSPLETGVGSELSVSTANKCNDTLEEDDNDDKKVGETQAHAEYKENKTLEKIQDQNPELEMKRAKSVRIVSEKEDASSNEMKLKNCPSFSASYVSGMHPLPSEVAADLKKGLYYFSGEEEEYGSSIFENWSVPGERNTEETKSKESRSLSWQMEDKLIPMAGKYRSSSSGGSSTKKSRSSKYHRRSRSAGGLLSCFGNAYGFEIRFICGSNFKEEKKKKKKKSVVIIDD